MRTKYPISEAKHGEKMIEVRVRFWTNNLVKKHKLMPRHAWDNGTVGMDSNKSHRIQPKSPMPFNSLLDLPSVLAKVLVQHGVTLHAGRKLRKLVQ